MQTNDNQAPDGQRVTPKACVAITMRIKPDHLLLAELTGDEAWHIIGKPQYWVARHGHNGARERQYLGHRADL